MPFTGYCAAARKCLTVSDAASTLEFRGVYTHLDMYEELDPTESDELDTAAAGADRRPSLLDSVAELPRVLLEMTALGYTWPALATAPRGDGHRVMVLPGFMAGDQSTLPLRRYLSRQNYRVHGWELGQNTGAVEQQEALLERFERFLSELPGTVSLVGQSLGGVYSRLLALTWPDRVRQVITLGSPFASPGPNTVNSAVSRLFQYMSGLSVTEMRDQMLALSGRLPVPTTAIYSKSDGVVHWTSCVEETGAGAENVEVLGSHSGMGFNPLVLYVVADRLAQPEGTWRPFERSGCVCSFAYPTPVNDARTP